MAAASLSVFLVAFGSRKRGLARRGVIVSFEAIIITILFLAPGFLGLQVYWHLVERGAMSTFGATTWSVILSVGSLAPWLLVPALQPRFSYLFDPGQFGPDSLGGVVLQAASSVVLAAITAKLVTGPLRRVSSKTLFSSGWIYFWRSYGPESRQVLLRTADGSFLGTLHYVGSDGDRDTIILNPAMYHDEVDAFVSTGMEFLLIPGREIQGVELSYRSGDEPDRQEPNPQRADYDVTLIANE